MASWLHYAAKNSLPFQGCYNNEVITSLLIQSALVLVIYMSLGYSVALVRRRLDTVDAAWGLGFVLIAWLVELQASSLRSLIITLLVSVWGLRLSTHIWRRNQGRADDPRYHELSRKWRGNFWVRAYFSIFLLQGALVWMIGLPVVLASQPQLSGLGWLTVAGGLLWLIGFIIEAIADNQLAGFLHAPDRPKVLQTGLWRYSRHPNYFGELLQWWGIGIIALQASYGWLGLAGPLTLTILILFISGIPPIERRRQKDPAYRDYQRRTSPLVLLPPRSVR
jgi:steroid 5-alpha reductase family enzyme